MCELHFLPELIQRETTAYDEVTGVRLTARLSVPKLRDGAVPTIFPNCPAYMSSTVVTRESPNDRKARLEEVALRQAISQSVIDEERHQKSRHFTNIYDLSSKLEFLDRTYWSAINKEDSLMICRVVQTPHPKIVRSVVIDSNCGIHAYINDVEVKHIGQYKVPLTIHDTNDLDFLLGKLRKTDVQEYSTSKPSTAVTLIHLAISLLSVIMDESFLHFHALKFVTEQLQLMTMSRPDYSSELLVLASLFYHCSRPGYRLLRDNKYVILPSYSTIRRIFLSNTFGPDAEQRPNNFLLYIKNKYNTLKPDDKIVTLMVDEIHIKPFFDYVGGNVVGAAFDTSEAATSAYVFMVGSIKSGYKDVVHIIPAKCMKAETLHHILRNVIIGLEQIGFFVMSVVTDNNAINGKALSLFAKPPTLSIVYPHPADKSRPLFFMYDAVHLLKCIRNNWLNQRDANQTMKYPEYSPDSIYYENHRTECAPFKTLKQLYRLESTSLLKQGYKLSAKAISPSNLERQNVKLAVQIFNEYVVQSLLTLGRQHSLTYHSSVANYINLIYTWWTIMNVQSHNKGIKTNNNYAKPLTGNTDADNHKFLKSFSNWLEVWGKMDTVGGKLSRETFTALKHTTHAIIELSMYCTFVLKMNFILTAKFQTDKLESRFGQYRQLAGSTYNISVRQIFECERKIRMMSVLQKNLPINNQKVVIRELSTEWEEMEQVSQVKDKQKFSEMTVTEDDVKKCEELLPVIVYLAGYCCYAVCKKNKCDHCKHLITCDTDTNDLPDIHSYLQGVSRGSLMHPDPIITRIVMYNYVVINKMSQDPNFHKITNHRSVATTVTHNILADHDALLPLDSCKEGHSAEKIEKIVIWASSNSLLNNYCSKENNVLAEKKVANQGKKRKLETLTQKEKNTKKMP